MCWFKRKNKQNAITVFPVHWKSKLVTSVPFYRNLSDDKRRHFEKRMLVFLSTTTITGIKTTVEDEDRMLLAASAIIPIFAFSNWYYHNLNEVLLYPAHFDDNFAIGSHSKAILGMVGFGYMDGKMIISKKSLHHGFKNETDKSNTAIHEFIHLIDKADGDIDGILPTLKANSNVVPWVHLMKKKIEEIRASKSDIRAYGATNEAEFLSVVGEYFFERPQLLAKKHPVLYEYMELIFGQPLVDRSLRKKAKVIQHWDPCPCDSGKKFRNCCLKKTKH